MFKHILMPVDGSLAMLPQVVRCLRFAAEAGAQVTALHVTAPHAGGDSGDAAEAARCVQIMRQVAREAAELGVPCVPRVLQGSAPWRAIVDAAAESGADLICMASHSRPAAAGQALGSQAAQVLVHAAVPVLVLR